MSWGHESDHEYYDSDDNGCEDHDCDCHYSRYDDYYNHVRQYKFPSEDGSCRFKDRNYGRELLTELASQRKTGEFLDVVVQVEGREFPCHRAVLASTPYFKAMLSSNLAESNSKVIQLRGVDSVSFSKILDFVYTGEIRVTKDDAQDILQAAHMLQFNKILKYCQEFIQENLDSSNCLAVLHLADMYNISALKKSARNKAAYHFSNVTQNEEFLSLSMQNLLDLLTDDDLQVTCEEDIVNAVIRWLDHAPEDRKTEVFQILREIRLSHVRVSVLRKLESHAVIQESSEFLAQIKAAQEEHLTGKRKLSRGPLYRWHAHLKGGDTTGKPRKGTSDDLAIIVGGWKEVKRDPCVEDVREPTPIKSIICLDPDSKQHYHVTNLPTPVYGYMSVTCTDRRLYVTGGRVHPLVGQQGPHSELSRQAFCYDFLTDTWLRLPDMPRGRAEHRSVVVNGKLFLVGGEVEATSVWSMDCYDLKGEAWIEPPVLPTIDASSELRVTSVGNKVVLIEVSKSRCKDRQIDYVQDGVALLLPAQLGSGIPTPTNRSRTKLVVHAFDVKTKRWVYSDTLLGIYNINIFTIAVDHMLYLRPSLEYHTDTFAYNAKRQTLTKVVFHVFTGSFLRPRDIFRVAGKQKATNHLIHNYKFEDKHWNGYQEKVLALPFALFGNTFLGTKKSTIGWYCRDLTELERDDTEDE